MKIEEIAFACSKYRQLGEEYDLSYSHFLAACSHQVDLNKSFHRRALLAWLNAWDCRQFAKTYHELASSEIHAWFEEFSNTLPPVNKTLLEFSDNEFEMTNTIFENLRHRKASIQHKKDVDVLKTVGLTGAAKILFAIRPNSFMPWDKSIRDNLALTYAEYLRKAKQYLLDLEVSLEKSGYKLSDLPKLVKRPGSSLPKLIDEYHWVIITRGVDLPVDLSRWKVDKLS